MKRLGTLRILEGLADRFLPALFWMLLIFGFDDPCIGTITVIAAAIHELGHTVALLILGRTAKLPEGRLRGLKIRVDTCSYTDMLIILSSGPLANILVSLFLLPLSGDSPYLKTVILINLATALSNLIPTEGYDGYGFIKCLLEERENAGGIRLLMKISFITSVALTFTALYLLSRFNIGYWLFGLFFTIILVKMKENLST